MQEVPKDREVLPPPRKMKHVEEEMPNGIRNAPPTKFLQTMMVGDVSGQVKVAPQRQQPSFVKHPATGWGGHHRDLIVESNSANSNVDPKRRRGKHDQSQNPQCSPPKGKDVMLLKRCKRLFSGC